MAAIAQINYPGTGDLLFDTSTDNISWKTPFGISPYGWYRTGTEPQSVSGRLTNVTGVPVNNTGAGAALSIFYTGYKGRGLPLWDGIGWANVDPGADLSQLLADATKSPAASVASTLYDIFGWLDFSGVAPVPRISRGPAWTTSTAGNSVRGAGTALSYFNGVLTNNIAITNGPGAGLGTYLGTIRTNAGNTLDFIHGASAVAAVLNVWNYYNRVLNTEAVIDAVADAYALVAIQQAGGLSTNQVNYTCGVAEDNPTASFQTGVVTSAGGAGVGCNIGIGDNSIAAYAGPIATMLTNAAAAQTASLNVGYIKPAGGMVAGYNYIAALENAATAVAQNFNALSASHPRQLNFAFPM